MKRPSVLALGSKVVFVAACVGLLSTLSGCNTVKGVGEDISNAGQAGQDAINNASDKK